MHKMYLYSSKQPAFSIYTVILDSYSCKLVWSQI